MSVLKTNSKTTTKYLGLLLAWLFTLTLALPTQAQVSNAEIEKENDSTAVDSLWSDSAVVKNDTVALAAECAAGHRRTASERHVPDFASGTDDL